MGGIRKIAENGEKYSQLVESRFAITQATDGRYGFKTHISCCFSFVRFHSVQPHLPRYYWTSLHIPEPTDLSLSFLIDDFAPPAA